VDEATSTLITQGGIFGAVFVFVTIPLAIYARGLVAKLDEVHAAHAAKLAEVQDARMDDAREVRDTLLAVTKEFSGALHEQVRTSTEVKGVYERTVATLERVEKRIETLEDAVRGPAHGGKR
jgi:hypothetical protein